MTQSEPFDSEADVSTAAPVCPKCQGPMWDNREGKRNPKAPDFKCKDKSCDGVIWPPRGATTAAAAPAAAGAAGGSAAPAAAGATAPEGGPACPICGGAMWDDRASKRNPKAPDFKCKNRPRERGGPGCEGVIWPPRDGKPSPYAAPARGSARPASPPPPPPRDDAPPPEDRDAPSWDDDDLPF